MQAPLPQLDVPDQFNACRTVTHPLDSGCRAICIQSCASSPLIFAATEHVVHIFDSTSPTALHTYAIPPLNDVARSPTAFLPIDERVLLVGDDAGAIHLFDIRQPFTSAVSLATTVDQADYISALASVDRFGTHAILATSGDGTICAYDVRSTPNPRVKLQYATDAFNDDLLSLAVLNGTPLAVAGSLSGALNLYNLRFLDVDADADAAAHIDRFHGHPECINAVVPCMHDEVVITACSDGYVRVVDVVNKNLLGVLDYRVAIGAEHDEEKPQVKRKSKRKAESRWPIESMIAIEGANIPAFALVCHDEYIRFCDGSALLDESPEDEEEKPDDAEHVPEDEHSRPRQEKGLSLPPEAELAKSSKKTKNTKKRRGKDDNSSKRKPDAFFDDL